MNTRISSKATALYHDYLDGKLELVDFQGQLEPSLQAFFDMSKDDYDEVNRIINQLEVILYTQPKDVQKAEVEKVWPKIMEYLKHKEILP